MTTDSKGKRDSTVLRDEVIGKVFVVIGQDRRRCLICDGVFTTQGAAEHAGTACNLSKGDSDHADR